MATVIEEKKYVMVEAQENHNKYWQYQLFDDGKVVVKYGRVGKGEQTDEQSGGRGYVDKKVREKLKKGYREFATLGDAPKVSAISNNRDLKKIATDQISGNCPIVKKLIERLSDVNAHQILTASGGKINVNLTTGVVSTPLGIVTQESIKEARTKLDTLSKHVKSKDYSSKGFMNNLNDYLMLIPQEVGHARGWHETFFQVSPITKQNDLLDSLEASIASVLKSSNVPDNSPVQKVFDVKMTLADDKTNKYLEKKYLDTRKDMHVCKNLKFKAGYNITISNMKDAFDPIAAKIGNIKELFHGSKISNLLSILKVGLIIPRSSDPHVCGRAYGDGVYGSSISTKSLNYSFGYWGNSGKYDSNCFMFVCDFAMGKEYIPSSSGSNFPRPGYDSTWAKPGQSGVINDEMIVYKTNQVNIKYLMEFEK